MPKLLLITTNNFYRQKFQNSDTFFNPEEMNPAEQEDESPLPKVLTFKK
jgi:hypothetical protein